MSNEAASLADEMIDSTGLCGVGDEAARWAPEFVVEPDARGEGQDPGADPGAQAREGACAVALQGEDVTGARKRCRRIPQKNREWLGEYPYA